MSMRSHEVHSNAGREIAEGERDISATKDICDVSDDGDEDPAVLTADIRHMGNDGYRTLRIWLYSVLEPLFVPRAS